MKYKLSQWHSEKTKPVHIGIYEVKCIELGQEYAWWGGRHWSPQRSFQKPAEYMHPCKATYQYKQWRGIVK